MNYAVSADAQPATPVAAVAPQRFEDHIGIIHMQAMFGFKWAKSTGQSLDYDDMFQEASLAFVLAAEGYKPEMGLKFSTYYTKVAFSQFRRAIGIMTGVKNLNGGQKAEIADRRAENKRRGAAAEKPLPSMNYGLRPVSLTGMRRGWDEEELESFQETIPSEDLTPEQALEFKQTWQQATANLSPLAQLVVEWLRDPPAELMRELKCQEAHADMCTARGVRTHGLRDGLSIDSIGKFIKMAGQKVPKGELVLVERELMDVVKRMEA
jgi:hypothetical protein